MKIFFDVMVLNLSSLGDHRIEINVVVTFRIVYVTLVKAWKLHRRPNYRLLFFHFYET